MDPRFLTLLAALVTALALGACSPSSRVTDPDTAGLVTVRGVVISVEDQRPVDGGVLVLVEPSTGGIARLYAESGMRPYVPGQDPQLVPTAVGLVPGDEVEGRGRPESDLLVLKSLRRLARH